MSGVILNYVSKVQDRQSILQDCKSVEEGNKIDFNRTYEKLQGLIAVFNQDEEIIKGVSNPKIREAHQKHSADLERVIARVEASVEKAKWDSSWFNPKSYSPARVGLAVGTVLAIGTFLLTSTLSPTGYSGYSGSADPLPPTDPSSPTGYSGSTDRLPPKDPLDPVPPLGTCWNIFSDCLQEKQAHAEQLIERGKALAQQYSADPLKVCDSYKFDKNSTFAQYVKDRYEQHCSNAFSKDELPQIFTKFNVDPSKLNPIEWAKIHNDFIKETVNLMPASEDCIASLNVIDNIRKNWLGLLRDKSPKFLQAMEAAYLEAQGTKDGGNLNLVLGRLGHKNKSENSCHSIIEDFAKSNKIVRLIFD